MASGGEEGRQLGHDLVVFDVDLEGFQDPAYQHVEADDGDHLDQLARRQCLGNRCEQLSGSFDILQQRVR